MPDDLEARVIAFIARQTGHDKERLTLDTEINNDLGVAGDDADELIEAFEKQFRVRTDYDSFWNVFAPEALDLEPFFRWLLRKPPRQLPPLTIRRMVDSARSGLLTMNDPPDPATLDE